MPERPEPAEYEVKGHRLTCPVCGQNRFWTRKTLMNTSAMTFFGFDWADKKADNYVCGAAATCYGSSPTRTSLNGGGIAGRAGPGGTWI